MKECLIFMTFALLLFNVTNAMDVPGYVVKNSKDTIHGQIVYTPPKAKGKDGAYEIDTSMFWRAKFITQNGGKESYKPNEINSFGFQVNGQWHHYETITLVKGLAGIGRANFFSRRIVEGAIAGFIDDGLDYFEIDDSKTRTWWFKTKSTNPGFVDDLIFSTKKKTLAKELKYFFQMEEAFLETIPEKIEKGKVYKVIQAYNDWKKNHN